MKAESFVVTSILGMVSSDSASSAHCKILMAVVDDIFDR